MTVWRQDRRSGKSYPFVPLQRTRISTEESVRRAHAFYAEMDERRSVRAFAPDPVPAEVIADLIRTAGTAPSGAHKQPWRFVAVSDPDLKRQIRAAAEEEERESYDHRMPEQWLNDLAPLGTDWQKEFLEVAPWLIIVFKQDFGLVDGVRRPYYYTNESVGIAVGLLIAAAHHAGLAILTHTPSPMGFLSRLLGRPRNEKPFVLLPVGYPAPDTVVPDIARKPFDEICTWR